MSPRLIKLALFLVLAAAATLPGSPVAGTAAAADSPTPIEARAHFEVRLRKLHLVRPDLIPYPLAFEVYC